MPPRKSNFFVAYVVFNLIVFSLVFVHAHRQNESARPALREKAVFVERLQLTDLCLFTDARYARHPSMADFHSPFQDSPMSMEHFPSGTILFPPGHLRTP